MASLSCWIVFTLPLGFAQPPATSCIVEKNGTYRLEVPDLNARSKRSTNINDFYETKDKDDEDLEVAANVVFERLRRSTDDNEVIDKTKKQAYDLLGNEVWSLRARQRLESNRIRRNVNIGQSAEATDLKYKQFVPQDVVENNPDAKEIDFRSLAKQNRPADVLEYKRFLKVSN